jgi:hypothetical protein
MTQTTFASHATVPSNSKNISQFCDNQEKKTVFKMHIKMCIIVKNAH